RRARHRTHDRGSAKRLFQQTDQPSYLFAPPITDVQHPSRYSVRRRMRQTSDNSLDDVVDISEISLQAAIVIKRYRLTGHDRAREAEIRHIRPAPGAIDGKEPQPGLPQTK